MSVPLRMFVRSGGSERGLRGCRLRAGKSWMLATRAPCRPCFARHTSRLKIKSCTRFMTLPIVASTPPSAFAGHANSMGTPLRSSPRDKSKLLIYVEAVRRLWASIVEMRQRGGESLNVWSKQTNEAAAIVAVLAYAARCPHWLQ